MERARGERRKKKVTRFTLPSFTALYYFIKDYLSSLKREKQYGKPFTLTMDPQDAIESKEERNEYPEEGPFPVRPFSCLKHLLLALRPKFLDSNSHCLRMDAL